MYLERLLKLINLKVVSYLFFAILIFWIAARLKLYYVAGNGYIVGDWLINYQDGGFKRRGLSGSILFLIQDLTGIKLIYLVFATHMALYIYFAVLIFKILYDRIISLSFFTLIISPLTFLFYYNDSGIVGRKEVILFVLFAYFIHLLSNKKLTKKKEHLIFALLFISTFLHELVLFYIPYFILALYLFNNKSEFRKYLFYFLSVLVPSLIIFIFGNQINEGQSLAIILDRGIEISKHNIFNFSNELLLNLQFYDTTGHLLYAVSCLMGIIHFGYHINKECEKHFNILIYGFIGALLFSLPLFVLAVDWGRWLHIHFVLLFLICAAVLPKAKTFLSESNIKMNIRNLAYIPLVLVLCVWALNLNVIGLHVDGFFAKVCNALLKI